MLRSSLELSRKSSLEVGKYRLRSFFFCLNMLIQLNLLYIFALFALENLWLDLADENQLVEAPIELFYKFKVRR